MTGRRACGRTDGTAKAYRQRFKTSPWEERGGKDVGAGFNDWHYNVKRAAIAQFAAGKRREDIMAVRIWGFGLQERAQSQFAGLGQGHQTNQYWSRGVHDYY